MGDGTVPRPLRAKKDGCLAKDTCITGLIPYHRAKGHPGTIHGSAFHACNDDASNRNWPTKSQRLREVDASGARQFMGNETAEQAAHQHSVDDRDPESRCCCHIRIQVKRVVVTYDVRKSTNERFVENNTSFCAVPYGYRGAH